jgi:enamine deaminase RidA (YjgF/YER057c/UK114 family)
MSTTDVYQRLESMGVVLPQPPSPVGNFNPHVRAGDFIYLSGQGPVLPDGSILQGCVGVDISVEEAQQHARVVGINLLAVLHNAIGDLNRMEGFVRLLGFVRAAADFQHHPKVIDGCSDLLVEAFGAAGRHARSAVGMGSLPFGISVEIEGTVLVRP